MDKQKIFYIIALMLFVAAAAAFILAMVFHAVLGNGSLMSIIAAIASAGTAFVGVIFACLSRKGGDNESQS